MCVCILYIYIYLHKIIKVITHNYSFRIYTIRDNTRFL